MILDTAQVSSHCTSCIHSSIYNQHSRHSDAGLSDNLWTQVFSWQFEGSIQ